MDDFVKEQISQLKQNIQSFENFLGRYDDYDGIELMEAFKRCCRSNGIPPYKIENLLKPYYVKIMNSNRQGILEGKSRIPFNMRIGPMLDDVRNTYLGQWITKSTYIYRRKSDPLPDNMVVTYTYQKMKIDSPPDPDPVLKMSVTYPGLIVGYKIHGAFIVAIIRYFGVHGEVCETHQTLGFYKLTHTKLKHWILRHKFNRIRRHIRNWVEHIRYRPGGVGFKRSLQSFTENKKKIIKSHND